MTSKSCKAKIFNGDPAKRPDDIMYLKLGCSLVGKDIDNRIKQEPFKFQYCLKLKPLIFSKTMGGTDGFQWSII